MSLCKIFFGLNTLLMVVCGTLITLCEPYIPNFISRLWRQGKFGSTKTSWFQKIELPKSYFRHFYISAGLIYYPLAAKEVIAVYIFGGDVSNWFLDTLNVFCGYDRTATVRQSRVFMAVFLLLLQVWRRLFETHFISVFSTTAKMSVVYYVVAMIYYPSVLLALLAEAPKFSHSSWKNLETFNVGIVDVFAVGLFLWAWYHQYVSAVILSNLRKDEKGHVKTHEYKIPKGDWFDYLSSPHYTAEILMYFALTLLLWESTTWWYVYVFVVCNQVEAIMLSHWWYQSTMKSFPRHIKALIPFVY